MSTNIENLLFKQVEKPKGYLMTKAINVYENRYRINVYCERTEDNLLKKRICNSYFAKLEDDKLEIINLSI